MRMLADIERERDCRLLESVDSPEMMIKLSIYHYTQKPAEHKTQAIVSNSLLLPEIRVLQTPGVVLRLVRLDVRLDIEALPDLARVYRQGLLAAAPRVIFTSLASDRGDRAVAVVGAIAKRHCLERHAVAARYIFWDVGRPRWASGFEAAAHAELLEGH